MGINNINSIIIYFFYISNFAHFYKFNFNGIILCVRKVLTVVITNKEVLNVLGKKLKRIRKDLKYTQEYVAENINISIDLLRNIENGRNVGSVTTILNLCNFLQVSPNTLFSDLINFKERTYDTSLTNYFKCISKSVREVLKKIILHIDRNY